MDNSHPLVLPFTKMQALGNDFIILDGETLLAGAGKFILQNWQEFMPDLSKQLCSRRLGIGADGLIIALNLKQNELFNLAKNIYGSAIEKCHLAWIFHNSDGSIAENCGNALRCIALWAHTEKSLGKQCFVATKAGIIETQYICPDEITVDLGEPNLAAAKIPFTGLAADGTVLRHALSLPGLNSNVTITCVNMGNPHCLIFANQLFEQKQNKMPLPFKSEEELNQIPTALLGLAQQIQSNPSFPQGVNVSFVLNSQPESVEAIVVERGCGPTLACGTAAAAIVVAGCLENRLSRKVAVTLPGGTLLVNWSEADNHVRITGPAKFSFHGEIALDLASQKNRLEASCK